MDTSSWPARHILPSAPASVPPGMRYYAIGDAHGRLDLLRQLLALIETDRQGAPAHIIYLGDYVDRGLESRGVIDLLISEQVRGHATFLMGNHEQVMLRVLQNRDVNLAADWLRFGGRETALSYGVRPPAAVTPPAVAVMVDELIAKVPQSHIDFLAGLKLQITIGDYYFCHAGVRPGVPLAQQTEQDLLWIRRDFMPHTGAYEKTIVHGHTVTDSADVQENRIGIDTGAYATGCLTALALEGNARWLLQTNR